MQCNCGCLAKRGQGQFEVRHVVVSKGLRPPQFSISAVLSKPFMQPYDAERFARLHPFTEDEMTLRTLLAFVVAACLCHASNAAPAPDAYDVVIYGGTSAGVIAAVQAGRMGKRVALVEPTKHLGGMTTGGLGATDMGNQKAIAGVSREFYQRILKHYADKSAWKYETPDEYAKRERYYQDDALFGFEPHVAEKIYNDMLAEAKATVIFNERLDLKSGVTKNGARIASIQMESGHAYSAKMFIDATYEGDLLAKASVAYVVNREANAQYGETINGIEVAKSKSHQFTLPVDPFNKPGDASSGLVPNIHAGLPGTDGAADARVQAYNYRLCTTNIEANRVPFAKPTGYDEKDFELLLRFYEAGFNGIPWGPRGMPNHKTDTNNSGAFSTDYIGFSDAFPDADYATRDKLTAAHIRYSQGLLWTLANHPRVPEKVRASVSKWGLAKDEFTDNQNWPYQLYVREGRRMVGEYVMTENDVTGKRKPLATDSVGLGSYGMDSHNTQRYVDPTGHARNEGDVQVHGFSPYGIAYRSLIPKSAECSNLLVPVCMSATHIAYGSIRMEPVYMILGQSTATAACLAIDENVTVQQLPYDHLKARLLADKQLLEWTGPSIARHAVIDLPGIVIDDEKAILTGDWGHGSMGSYVGAGYQHDSNEDKGHKSARFELTAPKDGRYEVRFAYVPNNNRATNVPVTIDSADGKKTVTVNEREAPPIDKSFISLGTFNFKADKPAVVTVTTEKTNGHVIIDAVQLLPAK